MAKKKRQRNQYNSAKSSKGPHNIRRLNIHKISENLGENEFNNFYSNARPSGSMHRMTGKKSTISSSGSSRSSITSVYDDDFFHSTDGTSTAEYSDPSATTNSTNLFDLILSDEATLSVAMQTVIWSAMIAGSGFLIFALFLAIGGLNINKINDNLEENNFNNFDSNVRLSVQKSTISSSGSSGTSVTSVYDDDIFHSADGASATEYSDASVTTNSTNVFDVFHSEESTLSIAMQTDVWSAMITGAGFLVFAMFLAIATAKFIMFAMILATSAAIRKFKKKLP